MSGDARDAVERLPLPEDVHVERLDRDLALLSFALPAVCIPDALTEAEQDVAARVYAGLSNDEIARARGASPNTVARQLESIYRKLGVGSRIELVLRLRGRTSGDAG